MYTIYISLSLRKIHPFCSFPVLRILLFLSRISGSDWNTRVLDSNSSTRVSGPGWITQVEFRARALLIEFLGSGSSTRVSSSDASTRIFGSNSSIYSSLGLKLGYSHLARAQQYPNGNLENFGFYSANFYI